MNFPARNTPVQSEMSPLYCSCCFFSVQFTVRNSNDLGGEECAILETALKKSCVSKIDGLELKFIFAICDVDRRQHEATEVLHQGQDLWEERPQLPQALQVGFHPEMVWVCHSCCRGSNLQPLWTSTSALSRIGGA